MLSKINCGIFNTTACFLNKIHILLLWPHFVSYCIDPVPYVPLNLELIYCWISSEFTVLIHYFLLDKSTRIAVSEIYMEGYASYESFAASRSCDSGGRYASDILLLLLLLFKKMAMQGREREIDTLSVRRPEAHTTNLYRKRRERENSLSQKRRELGLRDFVILFCTTTFQAHPSSVWSLSFLQFPCASVGDNFRMRVHCFLYPYLVELAYFALFI